VLHTPAAARGAAGATPGKEARIAHLAAPEEREDFYRAANVFVACEPHHELPFSALLAMACGAPVLAWKGSATAELVEHDRTGVLTDDPGPDAAAAALVRLAAEPERGASLGRRAAQWVRDERSLERAAREYGRCYRELLAAKFHRGT
jgi:glycosyltransferase involved in cell wall biosynthesis